MIPLKRITLILIAILVSSYCHSQDQYKPVKPDSDYFASWSSYADKDVFVLEDFTTLSYRYTDNFLGAIDASFRVRAIRNLRFKVNDMQAAGANLTIWSSLDSLALKDLVFENMVIYTEKNGKIKKTTVKKKSIQAEIKQDHTLLKLADLGATDGSIIDVEYSVNDVSKQQHRWSAKTAYFTVSSTFLSIIPEIYDYDVSLAGNKELEATRRSATGTLLGYYMPNVPLEKKLVTKTYYKIAKERGDDVSSAKQVFCGYEYLQYSTGDLAPSEGIANEVSTVALKLVSINPIVY